MSEFAVTLWIETDHDDALDVVKDRVSRELTGRRGDKVAGDIIDCAPVRLIDWQVVEVNEE